MARRGSKGRLALAGAESCVERRSNPRGFELQGPFEKGETPLLRFARRLTALLPGFGLNRVPFALRLTDFSRNNSILLQPFCRNCL